MSATITNTDEVEAFILDLVQALHRYGMPAYNIEDAMSRVGRRLGVLLEVFSTPTGLTIGIGPLDRQRVRLLRVQPASVQLARAAELAGLIEDFVAGTSDLPQARSRLAAITHARPPHGDFATAAAYGLASAASAVFFEATRGEVVASAAIGLLVGLLAIAAKRSDRVLRLFEVLAAALSATLAGMLQALPLGITGHTVTLAAIIVLVPGYTLTVALNELASRHWASGTARLGGAVTTLLLLGCGTAIGAVAVQSLAPMLDRFDFTTRASVPLPDGAKWFAVVLAPIAFKVLFQARHRDTLWIIAAGVTAYLGARFGMRVVGPVLGAGIGAFVLGIGSNLLARVRLRPAAITAVPGLLVLVPGSVGFLGVASFLVRDTVTGVDLVYRTLSIATAIVCGLLLASVVLPSRRSL